MAAILKYLPDSVVQKPRFPDVADTGDLGLFLSRVRAFWDQQLAQGRVENIETIMKRHVPTLTSMCVRIRSQLERLRTGSFQWGERPSA
jgi:hypothetical protein